MDERNSGLELCELRAASAGAEGACLSGVNKMVAGAELVDDGISDGKD